MSGSGPRRPHPPPTLPAVARVTPMVPEVSLFFPAQPSNSVPRVPLHLPTNIDMDNYGQYYNSATGEKTRQKRPPLQPVDLNSPSESLTAQSPAAAPAPHQPPTTAGLMRPQSDLSRMFAGGVDMTMLPGDDTQTFEMMERMADRGLRVEVGGRSGLQIARGTGQQMGPVGEGTGQQMGPFSGGTGQQTRPVSEGTGQQMTYPQQQTPLLSAQNPMSVLTNSRPNAIQSDFNTHSNSLEATENLPNSQNLRSVNQRHQTTHHFDTAPSPGTSPYPTVAQTSDSSTSPPPQIPSEDQLSLSSPSHQLMQMLSWQNQQLRQLQQQVKVLLESQSSPAAAPRPSSTCTAATMTSLVWQDMEEAMARLAAATDNNSQEEEEEEGDNDSLAAGPSGPLNLVQQDDSTSPQQSLHLDLPDYTPSEVSPPRRGRVTPGEASPCGRGRAGVGRMVDMRDIGSPVLGESVSMYENNGNTSEESEKDVANVQEMYDNILGNVKRLLEVEPLSPITEQTTPADDRSARGSVTPTPDSHDPPVQPVHSVQPVQPVDPVQATVDRLRQLGVSFISPADLSPAPPPPQQPPYYSTYLPTAVCPPMSLVSGASPDTSLDINSLALKYLDDSQLTKLAEKHRGVAAGDRELLRTAINNNMADSDSPVNFSMATQEFLTRHGLAMDGRGTAADQDSPQQKQLPNIPQPAPPLQPRSNSQPAQYNMPRGPMIENPQAGRPVLQNIPTRPLIQNVPNRPVQNLYTQPVLQNLPTKPAPLPTEPRPTPHNIRPQPILQNLPTQPPILQNIPNQPVFQNPVRSSLPQRGVSVPNRILDITAIRQQPKLL